MGKQYTEEDCLKALRKAVEILGKSPSKVEYRELDIEPTPSTISERFGSWNKAKKELGIQEFNGRRKIHTKTKLIDKYVDDETWKSLPSSTKSRLAKKSKLSRIKVEQGCQKCGYNKNPVPLEFHHRNREEKSFNVCRDYARKNVSWEKIKEEIKKCDVLCANCHRLEESKYFKEN